MTEALPLAGIKVLDVSTYIAAPAAAVVLGDYGADVIKVEQPGDGDPNRVMMQGASYQKSPVNYPWQMDARNKRSIALDLKHAAGRAAFDRLIGKADVLITNFPLPVRDRLRLHYADVAGLNERLVYASLTGYGETGPDRNQPGFDSTASFARSGLVDQIRYDGQPPHFSLPAQGDRPTAIAIVAGIMMALFHRERTGKGRRIELSMFDSMLNLLGYIGTMWLTNGELPRPPGSSHDYTVPWQAFKTSDGYLVVATRQECFWRKLCEVFADTDIAGDPRFATNASRVEHRDVLVPRLETIFRTRTTAAWLELMRAAEVPAAPVNNLDGAFAEPPVVEREMIVESDHPKVGKVRLPGNPIKMSGSTGTISRPAPLLGEHTDAVLSELLALSAGKITALRRMGAIG